MKNLHKTYDKLQTIYGDKTLNSVYGGGQEQTPKLCLVFMNPTARNIATNKNWTGQKYPWVGTKQLWNFLTKCNLFSADLNNKIQSMHAKDWDSDFTQQVYLEVAKNGLYITNLAKCTQLDARPLADSVYLAYKEQFLQEMDIVKPQTIFLFGNQVASILLNQKISVSQCRKQKFTLKTKHNQFNSYAIYYPVGNGFFNANKAIEDITQIVKETSNE